MTSQAVKDFAFANLELDHFEYKDNAMVVVLDEEELQKLKNAGIKYQIVVDDMIKYTTDFNRTHTADVSKSPFNVTCSQSSAIFTTPTSFGTGGSLKLGASSGTGYFKYSEMVTKMQALATAYPSIVSVFTIGNSEQGQAIYGVKISDNVATDESEPEILYTGLQHAREAIGGTSLIFFMQYLAENYGTNTKVTNLVDNREIFIIPCTNPDGYSYNYSGASGYPTTGGGLWRKNRRLISGPTYGVDLNRNYGIDWGNCSGASSSCGSSLASDDTYYGPSAFSEKETQAIRAFVQSHHFVAAIDQHCYGPYFSLPFGRPTLHTLSTDDQNYYSFIPALMGTYNCHRAGNSPETVNYEVAGGIKDWLLLGDIGTGTKGKVYGMTSEADGGDFWAPISQILDLCRRNCFQNIQLAYAAGSYFDIEDVNDIAVTATTGTLSFQLRSVGLATKPVTVTLLPLQGFRAAGSPVTTTINTYYGTYTGTISYTLSDAVTTGSSVGFVWKVESDGIIIYDTVQKVYNPVVLFSDDMEGTFANNWTTTSNVNTTAGKWAYTTTAAYAGTHSLTESPSGNYTTSTTRTVTCKTTLNLQDAQEAYLSFWVKHRAENCNDKMQTQLSINGSTFTAICGTHTVSENIGTLGGKPALTGIRPNWTREIFDISTYKGNASVTLRFEFTSDADGGSFAYELDDGFYIDNVKVVKTSVFAVPLGVKFINFDGKLLPDNTVQLNWEAVTDQQHDHFEVERSENGISFISLGRSVSQPPYKFIDASPFAGTNYYRIKQVDMDGHITYSRTIALSLSLHLELKVYPNPAKDIISLETESLHPAMLQLQITNSLGQVVYQRPYSMEAGKNKLTIDSKDWKPSIYMLRLFDNNGSVISVHRVVKL